MLKPDLDQLIEEYETEKNNLGFLIQECLMEFDYLGAHYHFEALCEVNFKLQTLHNLKDPFYDSKKNFERTKSFYQKNISEDQYAGMESYFNDRISEIEKKLHDLNKQG